jgi:hypothetical protein
MPSQHLHRTEVAGVASLRSRVVGFRRPAGSLGGGLTEGLPAETLRL